jgi:hypothetical protein
MASPRPEDMRAGFTGLIVGAVFLLIILTTIVHLTHRHYASEKPAAAAER